MKELNKKFRNKNKPTDVLSFPSDNKMKYKKNLYLGDIAISYEIVNKRSKNSNFSLEFDKMWIHGYLHLLGYDHKKKKDFMKLKKLEDLILIKCTPDNEDMVKECILKLHHYEVPELISSDFNILNPDYEKWFSDNSM